MAIGWSWSSWFKLIDFLSTTGNLVKLKWHKHWNSILKVIKLSIQSSNMQNVGYFVPYRLYYPRFNFWIVVWHGPESVEVGLKILVLSRWVSEIVWNDNKFLKFWYWAEEFPVDEKVCISVMKNFVSMAVFLESLEHVEIR